MSRRSRPVASAELGEAQTPEAIADGRWAAAGGPDPHLPPCRLLTVVQQPSLASGGAVGPGPAIADYPTPKADPMRMTAGAPHAWPTDAPPNRRTTAISRQRRTNPRKKPAHGPVARIIPPAPVIVGILPSRVCVPAYRGRARSRPGGRRPNRSAGSGPGWTARTGWR